MGVLLVGLLAVACSSRAVSTVQSSTTMSTAPISTTAVTSTTTSTAATLPTTTNTTLPPLVLGFAGDTQFTYGLDSRDPFGEIVDLLIEPDLMFVNLETTIAEPDVGTAVDKTYVFKSPPKSVELLTDAGIDVVQLANNHMLDYGPPALTRTLEILDEAEVAHAGAGTDPAEAYAPRFIEVSGYTVGVVAFSRIPCDWSIWNPDSRPQVAWTCDAFIDRTLEAVDAAAAEADVVVVMAHWGIEGNHCRLPSQRELAERWAEHGADLVVGGHPHVLQGVERIAGTWLVDSTGNFAFPSARGATADTAVFDFTVTENGVTLRAIPVTISGGRPSRAEGASRERILNELTSYSFGVAFEQDGSAVPTGDRGMCGPIPPTPAPLGEYRTSSTTD